MSNNGPGRRGPRAPGWSEEEEAIIREAYATGPRWIIVAMERMPNRSYAAIMTHVTKMKKLSELVGKPRKPAKRYDAFIKRDHDAITISSIKESVRTKPPARPGENVPAFLRDTFKGWGVG